MAVIDNNGKNVSVGSAVFTFAERSNSVLLGSSIFIVHFYCFYQFFICLYSILKIGE
jgi:hypothetical protein